MAADSSEFVDPVGKYPRRSPREMFARLGYAPVPPAETAQRQLSGRLWEFFYAAAGCRLFFQNTNHLGDRELYTLLWERWLDTPTEDIPLEDGICTTFLLDEFDLPGMTHQEIHLRFYADEEGRRRAVEAAPWLQLPRRENPPYDRDRFLPMAPMRFESDAEDLLEDEEAEEVEGDESFSLGLSDSGAEMEAEDEEESFLPGMTDDAREDLHAAEPEDWTPPAQTLVKENVPLLPPDEITDETLAPILWELLHNLALRGFYVLHTDHMSDRELYSDLWHHGLREPAHLPGRNYRGGWFHDFLGGWGEEEMRIWLRYYASDDERSEHMSEWPTMSLPLKEERPFRRDWRLPKGPF